MGDRTDIAPGALHRVVMVQAPTADGIDDGTGMTTLMLETD